METWVLAVNGDMGFGSKWRHGFWQLMETWVLEVNGDMGFGS